MNNNNVKSTPTTWIELAKKLSGEDMFSRPRELDADSKSLVDYFIQAAMENPEDFQRAFLEPLGPGKLNPLLPNGAGALRNLVCNGVFDDWELWLQWREEGYRVVGDNLRQDQDQRLNTNQAIRLLDIITGGRRDAPGIANMDAWVQDMYEAHFPVRKGPKV